MKRPEFIINDLYLGRKKTGYSVVKDETYEGLWRVKYPDGNISEDLYNKTRAKEHCYRLYLDIKNYDDGEGLDSF